MAGLIDIACIVALAFLLAAYIGAFHKQREKVLDLYAAHLRKLGYKVTDFQCRYCSHHFYDAPQPVTECPACEGMVTIEIPADFTTE